MHRYEIRPRKDHRGVDLISDALPFGRLWYGEPNAISNAIGYAKHRSRSHHGVIRVYDAAGNVIETQEYWLRLRACRNSDHIRLRTGAAAVVGTHTVVISPIIRSKQGHLQ